MTRFTIISTGKFPPLSLEAKPNQITFVARTGVTKRGEQVILHDMIETEDGWICYVLGQQGYAVLTFIPMPA